MSDIYIKKYRDIPPRSKSFSTLFHGTPIENAALICKNGFYVGSFERIGYISRDDPMGVDRMYDCVGYVNMAKDRKHAIFFASSWRELAKDSPGQAIFEIDASKLDKDKMEFRRIFGRPWAEVKYKDDIPPDAIKRVFIRKFNWTEDDMTVEESFMTCDEILADEDLTQYAEGLWDDII